MIYTLRGKVVEQREHTLVVEVGGVGLRVMVPKVTADAYPTGSDVVLATHLHVREDALDLFGFTNPEMRDFFEMLIGVNGVGPKSALAILDVAALHELKTAIHSGRPDLLTRAAGIGRKTAERVVLELRGKVMETSTETKIEAMEGDIDVIETLVGLGYKKDQAKQILKEVDPSVTDIAKRLKMALALLSGKNK
jgi:Holliday junction DNA helicase RuvA